MQTIAAAKFKAQCLALIDEVAQTNEVLVITKHGKPLAKLVPFENKPKNYEKPLKSKATFIGDVISPIDVEWDANK
ncbi:MAG: type II toxin-antitoxin system Phd/YefM family antitoxin [Deferribacteres bacterium]|nr:type II toxin-antitoxin system Phd/YefM family antitoxin [candidate division KSB1 bacterium]MCB9500464.1 type II toxin-antitoxin system Phd/YefM family antitoxin [Deferribacteres bacterium]